MDDEEFVLKAAQSVAAGGWSSIYSLVSSIPIEILRDIFCFIEENDEDEEEDDEYDL